jgi:hypothetical protein
MNKYHNTFKTDLNCPLQKDIFNNMNEQQKRFFGYTENYQLPQVNDTTSIKYTKTKNCKSSNKNSNKNSSKSSNKNSSKSSNKNSNKNSSKSSMLIPSYELQMKAAGYLLAASNASKREAKIKKL